MAHSVSQPGSTATMPPTRLSYREIADDLGQRIASGEYPPGAQLPSTSQLAELYSVNRSTIVRAMGLLHDRRVVVGVAGRGVYVSDA